MSSFNEEFDDSSTTRGASDFSAINKSNSSSNDFSEEQKNIDINDVESDTTKSINSTITPPSTDGNNTNVSLCNEKIQQQDDRSLYGK